MSTKLSKKLSLDDVDKIVEDLNQNFKWVVTEINPQTTQVFSYPATQFMKAYIRYRLRCIKCDISPISTRVSFLLVCDGDMLRTKKIYTFENRSAQLNSKDLR